MQRQESAHRSNPSSRAVLAFLFALCGSAPALALTGGSEWNGQVHPLLAEDINPDPSIVEVVLVAQPAKVHLGAGPKVESWTYNGGVPGPTIVAHVGDTLIVHLYNELPEATTIHWHGLEVPANMDGSNIAQLGVEPGGYFRYEFQLLRPALFWYHPHARTHVQVERGLHGALLVLDAGQDAALGLPEDSHVLVLDDVLLTQSGEIAPDFPTDPLENAVTHVNGREGNVLLANGRPSPTARIQRGIPQRLRVVNVANSRFMRLSFPGQQVWRIGGDGGLLEAPIEIAEIDMVPNHHAGHPVSNPDPSKGLLLTPGERADLVFVPTGHEDVRMEWHDMPRGRHSASYDGAGAIVLGHGHDDGHAEPQTLVSFHLTGADDGEFADWAPPAELRDITPIDPSGATVLPVRFGHGDPDPAGNVVFFAQMVAGMPRPFPLLSAADAYSLSVGETAIWDVWNMTGGDHNFHAHGFSFQVLETQYHDMDEPANNFVIAAPYLEDKDTVYLPARPGAKGRSRTVTRLVTRIDDTGREGQVLASGKEPTADESGGWLFHCHLLEHSASGMMSFFQVVE